MRPGPRRFPEEGGEGAGGARGTGSGAAAPVDTKGFGIGSPPRLPARLRIAMVIPVSLKYRGPGRARRGALGCPGEARAPRSPPLPGGDLNAWQKDGGDKGCSSRGVRRALFPGFRSWPC